MTRLAPATCALLGACSILVGTIFASVFVIRQTHCEMSQVLLAQAPGCTGDTIGSVVGWVLLAAGALTVVLAAMLSTPLFAEKRRRRSELPED
jgi:hypothetical protein